VYRSRLTRLALVAVAAAVAAASATAAPPFHGNVCGLLTARQIATLPGVSARCTNLRPAPGPGSTNYVGHWAGKTPGSAGLQVTVASYADQGALALAKRNLNQGFPGGTPKRAAGIGTGAYEAAGAGSSAIHFGVGKYVVYVIATPAPTSTRRGSGCRASGRPGRGSPRPPSA
jgi:hypothetical protein